MTSEQIVKYEVNTSLHVLNYAITEGLPDTAKEVARWMAAVALTFTPDLPDGRYCTFAQKPYILKSYQDQSGAR